MPRTTTCTHHCSACAQHFHSLEAVDAHRVGDFASKDPEAARRCEHPLDLGGRLLPLTVDGECRLGDGSCGERGTVIWTTVRHERAATAPRGASLDGARRRPRTPSSGLAVDLAESEPLSVRSNVRERATAWCRTRRRSSGRTVGVVTTLPQLAWTSEDAAARACAERTAGIAPVIVSGCLLVSAPGGWRTRSVSGNTPAATTSATGSGSLSASGYAGSTSAGKQRRDKRAR